LPEQVGHDVGREVGPSLVKGLLGQTDEMFRWNENPPGQIPRLPLVPVNQRCIEPLLELEPLLDRPEGFPTVEVRVQEEVRQLVT